MDCPNIREKLSAYLDEALSSQEKMAVDEHLRSCSRCAADLADLKEVIQLAKELKPVEPPPWLTQKIMARVRAEAQPKKRLYQKLFYPLYIKLPVGAVATIAIALTTLYIFRTIEPEIKLAKAPTEESAPQVSQEKEQPAQRRVETDKVLPSAPLPQPALPLPQPRNEEKLSSPEAPKATEQAESSQEQRAPAQVLEMDRSMPAAGAPAKKEAKSEAAPVARRLKAQAEEKKEGILITVYVKDMESARKVIEKDVMELGGKIVKKESFENRDILSAEIEARNLREFHERLLSVGQLKTKDVDFEKPEGEIRVSIEVVRVPEER